MTAGTAPNGIEGRVSGAVLAALRAHCGLTQEQLGEQLGVVQNTVGNWEGGALPWLPFMKLQAIRRTLQAAGSESTELAWFDKALQVDAMWARISEPDPRLHPLSLVVPDRDTTELLAWPMTGEAPRELSVSSRLHVPRGTRDEVAASLRGVVDNADPGSEAGAMLRRQVKYLLSRHEPSRGWVDEQEQKDTRRGRDLRSWTPEWPVARSSAISAAAAGNPDPLQRFCDRALQTDQQISANLTYWAYWVGEHRHPWDTDAAMTADADSWTGERLLNSLLGGIVHAPYRDLCAHSLWALLRARRRLAEHPHTRRRIQTAVRCALDERRLGPDARTRLDQVDYLVGSEQ